MPKKSTGQPRGRPPFKPTEAQRRDVSIAAGGGMTHEEIAIGIGIDRDTLRKHFEHELSIGANQRRMEALKGLHKAAKRGNSGAAKAYLANSPALSVPPANPADKPAAAAAAKKEPELGKKEQADVNATTAQVGTEWAELLPGHTTKQ